MSGINQARQIWTLIILVLLGAVLAGCGKPRLLVQGRPVEPLVPGEEKGETQALTGRFAVKSSDIQIMDLSVTADGSLAAVGSASRTVYLLERDGKLRWERQLNSLPLQTYLEPAGRFIAVGTAGGRLLIFNTDQTIRFEQSFGHPVGLLDFSADGEVMLAAVFPEDQTAADKLVVLDRFGRQQWEREFDELFDARFAGPANTLFLNWRERGVNYLGAFTAEGEEHWRVADRYLQAVSEDGRRLVTSSGKQVHLYNNYGEEEWTCATAGTVRRLTFSANGLYLSVLVRDEATNKEELVFLGSSGDRLWSKRLPDDSELLVSQDGRRVIVASWRQYRDDATQIQVYNQRGQEVNTLEVTGRVQRLALQADTLVFGLEDGSIFFLNITQPAPDKAAGILEQPEKTSPRTYYQPVGFTREKDESLLMLFFYDQNAQALVPVTRRSRLTQSVLRASIEELIRGPVQGSHLQRTIPKDAEIGITLLEGTAVIDLPVSLDGMGGTTFLSGVLDSLLLTVSQFPTVEEVRFTVGGAQKDTFGLDGLLINEAFLPNRLSWPRNGRTIYLPYRSGERYYLLPVAHEFSEVSERELAEAIVQYVLREAADYFPANTMLRNVSVRDGAVILDFSGELGLLVSSGGTEAAARAALVRDAIALSLAENLPYISIKFLAGSEELKVPPDFPAFELNVTKPYYINQEE
jgi:spore germination protein GerM/outer membrane protein assembly factor BamB